MELSSMNISLVPSCYIIVLLIIDKMVGHSSGSDEIIGFIGGGEALNYPWATMRIEVLLRKSFSVVY